MDYFTKWIEAEPLANIKDLDAKRFLLEKYCHSVWNSSYPHLGQWSSI